MALRELLAKFVVEVDGKTKLEEVLGRFGVGEEKAKALGKALSALKVAMPVAALGVGVKVFRSWVQGSIEAADAMGELGEQIGFSASGVQKWSTLIQLAGGRAADLGKISNKVAADLQAAAEGAGKQREQFKALGVEYLDQSGQVRELEDVILDLSAAIGQETNATARLALAKDVLGKGGAKLANSLRGTREEMRALLDQVGDVSGGFSDEFVAAAQQANDELDFMHGQFATLKADLVVIVLPVFRWMTRTVTDVVRAIRGLLTQTGILDRWAKASPFLGGAAGLALLVKNWRLIWTWMTRVFALIRPFIPMILKFLFWALVLDDIITFLQGGESALGKFLDRLIGAGAAKQVLDLLKNSLDLIVAGVQTLGEDIAWLWSKVTDGEAIIAGMRDAFESALMAIGEFLVEGPQRKFEMFLGLLEKIWGFVSKILNAPIDGVKNALSGLADLQFGNDDAKANAAAQAAAIAEGRIPARAPRSAAGGNRQEVNYVDRSSVSVSLTGAQTPDTVRTATAEAKRLRGDSGKANALVRGGT